MEGKSAREYEHTFYSFKFKQKLQKLQETIHNRTKKV